MQYKTIFITIFQAFTSPGKIISYFKRQINALLFWKVRYNAIRQPKILGGIYDTEETYAAIIHDLAKLGVEVVKQKINKNEFERYIEKAGYNRFKNYQKGGLSQTFRKKALEHFLSSKLLQLSHEDIFIDIANFESPVPEIFSDLFGCLSYRQDITFEHGLHGNRIGSNAAAIPVPNAFLHL